MFFDPDVNAKLAVLALGVVGDQRPQLTQPKLKEGIHLRWGFARGATPAQDRGFPWYGYYLFRRITPTGGTPTACAAPDFRLRSPGLSTQALTVSFGTFHSSSNLNLTEDFAPSDTIEIDLSPAALTLNGNTGEVWRSVVVTLGFVEDFPPPGGSGDTGGGDDSSSGGDLGDGSSGSGDSSTGDTGTGTETGDLGDGSDDGGTSSHPGDGVGTHDSPGDGKDGELGGSAAADSSSVGCVCVCEEAALRPIAERVVLIAPGQYQVTFSYSNRSDSAIAVPLGSENDFFPVPRGRGQPTLFLPGERRGAFSVVFDGQPLTWRLTGSAVTVSASDVSAPGASGGGTGSGGSAGGSGAGTGSGSGSGTGSGSGSGTGTGTGGGSGAGSGSGSGTGSGAGGAGTASGAGGADGIVITAYRSGFLMATRIARGSAGQVVPVSIDAAAIDEIRISSGPARLIDVCVFANGAALGEGWEPLPGVMQPLGLPVRHPDYPCNRGTPDEMGVREAIAIPRISYDDPSRWRGAAFTDLHEALLSVVDGGPSKGITEHVEDLTAAPDPADPAGDPPQLSGQSTLNLLLSAAIHPAVAQMLGLYWVDDTAETGVSYDYLIVADNTNAAGLDLTAAAALVAAADYSQLDGCMVVGAMRAVSPPLDAPTDVRVYALPVGAIPPTVTGDAAGTAGLAWRIPLFQDSKIPQSGAILFQVWRADLGRIPAPGPTGEALDSAHVLVSAIPVAPGEMLLGDPGPTLPGWPTVRLFATDGPLLDGWYGYKVSGIDIFGRYSALSKAGAWLAVNDQHVANDFAVHIIDAIPPPPPTQVQAWVLDPDDPFVTKDDAYNDWPSAFRSSPGLRVRWVWTGNHMRQAPDLREFRVYCTAGTAAASSSSNDWDQRIAVVAPTEHVAGEDALVTVRRGDGSEVEGTGATLSSSNSVTLGGTVSLAGLPIDGYELELSAAVGATSFRILELDAVARTVLVAGAPQLTGTSPWRIVLRERTYELFLPNTGLPFTLPLSPTLQTPTVYGLCGVTAADDKTEAGDGFTGSGPYADRYGNESLIGGPATVYRVKRSLPDPTSLPPLPGKLFATRADFYGLSFFALHWLRQDSLTLHVFRAMDQALFQIDARKGFSGTPRSAELAELPLVPGWNTTRQQAAIVQLNSQLHAFPDYQRLSDDALRLLASLPSNSEAFTRLTQAPIGGVDPKSNEPLDPDFVGPNDSSDSSADNYYVPDPGRGAFIDTLDGRGNNHYFYRTAAVDGAQNTGPLGLATPPVYLPATALPPTPTFISVTGQDMAIELVWADQPELNVASYILYGSDDPNAAQDIAAMREVATVTAGSGEQGLITVTDTDVVPLQDTFYRLVSIASSGAPSRPSAVVRGRALRTQPAFPPELSAVELMTSPSLAFQLTFSAASDVAILVQRRAAGRANWSSLSGWLAPGTTRFVDSNVAEETVYEYRLRGKDISGIQTEPSATVVTEPT